MSSSQPTVLIVGGTGPSGVCIVEQFLAAGYAVTIYHTGRHEAEYSGPTEHIHGDPREETDIREKLAARQWDLAVCTSGRLRALALCLAGQVRRLVGITGQPVYLGTMKPTPAGTMALPIPEDAERQFDASGYTGKVAIGEDQLFEQHRQGAFEAVIVRYPGVYGPRGPLSHEWAVVRRILDGRSRMILPHDGMAHFQRGYVENLGRLVFLAGTVPQAAGEAFNAGDETVLSARHVAELIIDELGAKMELIGVPAEWCRGAYPLAEKSSVILDMSKARRLLGYRDVLDVQAATRLTARWLAGPQARTMEFSDVFGGKMS
nr:NAD-dependent epimerase/dehydratase family protein [Burkholderiaceae bacterium]